MVFVAVNPRVWLVLGLLFLLGLLRRAWRSWRARRRAAGGPRPGVAPPPDRVMAFARHVGRRFAGVTGSARKREVGAAVPPVVRPRRQARRPT